MPSDLVTFKADSGADVRITKDEVKACVCKDATDSELYMFLRFCEAHRLDPIGFKDAYLVKYNGPAQMITSYQVFNRRARRCKDYRGIESGVVVQVGKDVRHKQGSAVYPGEHLLGGWARVHVAGWDAPVYSEVSMADYSTGRSNWRRMPGMMIEKVAKSTAWRTAYPDEFGGMYTAEEMDQAAPDVQAEGAVKAEEKPEQAPARVGEAVVGEAEAARALEEVRGMWPEFRDAMPGETLNARNRAAEADLCAATGAKSMQEMTPGQAERAAGRMRAALGYADDPAYEVGDGDDF